MSQQAGDKHVTAVAAYIVNAESTYLVKARRRCTCVSTRQRRERAFGASDHDDSTAPLRLRNPEETCILFYDSQVIVVRQLLPAAPDS